MDTDTLTTVLLTLWTREVGFFPAQTRNMLMVTYSTDEKEYRRQYKHHEPVPKDFYPFTIAENSFSRMAERPCLGLPI